MLTFYCQLKDSPKVHEFSAMSQDCAVGVAKAIFCDTLFFVYTKSSVIWVDETWRDEDRRMTEDEDFVEMVV